MKFVKEVLQIIPKKVFDLLEQLIEILAHKLKALPLKTERASLK